MTHQFSIKGDKPDIIYKINVTKEFLEVCPEPEKYSDVYELIIKHNLFAYCHSENSPAIERWEKGEFIRAEWMNEGFIKLSEDEKNNIIHEIKFKQKLTDVLEEK